MVQTNALPTKPFIEASSEALFWNLRRTSVEIKMMLRIGVSKIALFDPLTNGLWIQAFKTQSISHDYARWQAVDIQQLPLRPAHDWHPSIYALVAVLVFSRYSPSAEFCLPSIYALVD